MLQSFFDISREDRSQWDTCQMVMEPSARRYPLIQRLIDHPEHLFMRVDDRRRGYSGLTLLHLAGSGAVAQMLLHLGLDPNARDCDGNTPLHFAALRGNHNLVQFLLASQANPSVRNHIGEFPFQWALTLRIALLLCQEKKALSNIENELLDQPIHLVFQKQKASYAEQFRSLGIGSEKQIKRVEQWYNHSRGSISI
ncbi:Ankyrin repeat-containing protein [Seinonella peptonophila]|uniref:Ankyrin repeat-containing protein n=1 Tax=Seinonella peptonophila TaxID=112248 RepID=A0A1M4WGN4_9BACL|nr:ankyrin repeat domain-containing protein [Seinonella peptonophila]SHE80233.1 Ankyrin repeat-containing protein [Seinonella peptonophila]